MSSVEQESQFSPNKHVLKYIFVFKNYTKESHNGGVKQKTSSFKVYQNAFVTFFSVVNQYPTRRHGPESTVRILIRILCGVLVNQIFQQHIITQLDTFVWASYT